jgi:hypothetical protein
MKKVWKKVLLTILFAIFFMVQLAIPVGSALSIPSLVITIVIVDAVLILGIMLFSLWCICKVGADSERGKDE